MKKKDTYLLLFFMAMIIITIVGIDTLARIGEMRQKPKPVVVEVDYEGNPLTCIKVGTSYSCDFIDFYDRLGG